MLPDGGEHEEGETVLVLDAPAVARRRGRRRWWRRRLDRRARGRHELRGESDEGESGSPLAPAGAAVTAAAAAAAIAVATTAAIAVAIADATAVDPA